MVLDRLAEAWLESVQGVDDYTVVGSEFTTHYKKVIGESGKPHFKSVTESGMSGMRMGTMSAGMGMSDWNELRDRAGAVARHVGMQTLRGENHHVLLITDLNRLDAVNIGTGTRPDSIMMYVNPSNWTLSRVTIHGGDVASGASGTVTPTIDFEDYRKVESLRIPFSTKVTMVGMTLDISPEQVAQAQAALVQLEARMKDMPEGQRDMMMAQIKPQMERLQKMADSGTLEQVFTVESVTVNPGLPDSMFQ